MPRLDVEHLLHRLLRRAGARPGGTRADGALLEQFGRTRDEAAFAALVERHGPMVFGVCRRVLGHHQDAEDAFQAAFLILARRAAHLRGVHSVAAWLHTVAYRLAVRARAGRRPTEEGRDLDMLPAEPDLVAVWRDLRPVLDEELQRLPEKYRAPVVLCYLEGRTHAEAAEQLGWPKGTVAGRLARARDLLRGRLTRRGITLSAGLLGTMLTEHAAAAILPAGLAKAAVGGAVAFAVASTAGIAAKVLALAEGGLQAMFTAKVKVGAALVTAVVLALAGAGVWARQALREGPTEEAQADAGQQPAKTEAAQVRLDRHGDPLPEGAVARLGTVRWRRPDTGNILFSPDGKVLASGEYETSLSFWDVASGRLIRRIATRWRPTAFSADGRELISVRGAEVKVWDVATGRELRQFSLVPGPHQAWLSPDRKLLVGSGQKEIRVYDADTGKSLRVLESSEGVNTHVNAISPDGKFLVGQDGQHYRKENGESGWKSNVWLWNLPSGKKVRKIGDPSEPKSGSGWAGAAFSGDGQLLATGSFDGSIYLWDVASGKEVRRMVGHDDKPHALVFSRDNARLFSRTCSSAIHVWDVATGRELQKLGERLTYWTSSSDHGLEDLALSPDGALLAVSRYHSVQLWEVVTGKEAGAFEGHHDGISAVTFSTDGRTVLSVDRSGCLNTWEAATGRLLRSHQGKTDYGRRFSPDGKLLAYFVFPPQSGMALRDTASGTNLRQFPLPVHSRQTMPCGLDFSPDGTTLAVSVGNFTLPPRFQGKNPVTCDFGLWDVADGKERWRRALPVQGSVAFSPDGVSLAFRVTSSGKDVVEFWDTATGQPRYQFTGDGFAHGCRALAFSPDGKTLVTYSNTSERIPISTVMTSWEVATGQVRGLFTGHDNLIEAIAFSPDGRLLASACHDNTVRLWDVATCQECACLRDHSGWVRCLAFSRDGRFLVTGGDGATLLVWDVARLLPPRPRPDPPAAEDLEHAWTTLAGTDAKAAHRAVYTLASIPEPTVTFLRQRLKPAAAIKPEQLARWVRELDDVHFEVRDRAGRELEKAGLAAEGHLTKALAREPSLELRQRVDALLKKMNGPVTQPELLRALRAVELLERIGTPEARAVLKTLADGAAEARLTREAKAALRYLEQQAARSPAAPR